MGITKQGEIRVKYTWNGDANLDGVVNADDYFQIDSGFISRKKGWYNGDFNYDEVINADDYFLIDSTFIGQSGPLGGASAEGGSVFAIGQAVREKWRGVMEQLVAVPGVF